MAARRTGPLGRRGAADRGSAHDLRRCCAGTISERHHRHRRHQHGRIRGDRSLRLGPAAAADRLLLFAPEVSGWSRPAVRPTAPASGSPPTSAPGDRFTPPDWLIAAAAGAPTTPTELASARQDPEMTWNMRPDTFYGLADLSERGARRHRQVRIPTAYFYGAKDRIEPLAATEPRRARSGRRSHRLLCAMAGTCCCSTAGRRPLARRRGLHPRPGRAPPLARAADSAAALARPVRIAGKPTPWPAPPRQRPTCSTTPWRPRRPSPLAEAHEPTARFRLLGQGHRGAGRPRAGAQAAGHVHRRRRRARAAPPVRRGARQRHGRGRRRPRQGSSRSAWMRDGALERARRRARHAGRPAPQVPRQVRRSRSS